MSGLVIVCSAFLKNYQGKITLSSANATEVYNNVDIPEIIGMRARCPYARPPRHITVPIKKGNTPIHIFDPDNRKTISQLLRQMGSIMPVNIFSYLR
ncbi:hypothetical protein MKX01_036950 [Papaver californicum]|nr:hypothetical protein MKX01_036950 [Papaver californicum]